MDHFIGFDRLLRLSLGREKRLTVYGPSGMIDKLESKLSAYSWNLVQNYTNHFEIRVYEIDEDLISGAYFVCQQGFKRNPIADARPFDGLLLDEPGFTVSTVILDHMLPSLAFCFEEKVHLNINQVRLPELGLAPGPWLRELKEWIWEGRDERETFSLRYESEGQEVCRSFPLGELKRKLVSLSRGEKIAYVADAVYNTANAQKILQLASGADYFFCEAAFMDKEREQARKTYHLTAKQAGELAKRAGVRRFVPFHFSPRYHDNPEQIEQEAQTAFRGNK
jgi:ribonuclease Z